MKTKTTRAPQRARNTKTADRIALEASVLRKFEWLRVNNPKAYAKALKFLDVLKREVPSKKK